MCYGGDEFPVVYRRFNRETIIMKKKFLRKDLDTYKPKFKLLTENKEELPQQDYCPCCNRKIN